MKKRKMMIAFIVLGMLLVLSACGAEKGTAASPGISPVAKPVVRNSGDAENTNQDYKLQIVEAGQNVDNKMLQMKIDDMAVAVSWEDNATVHALKELCARAPLTVRMSMYGGFEQVGSIGKKLPQDDRQITTVPGDIMLYSGNRIVVFYGSNSWSYTKLGRISNKNVADLAKLLGNGDITLTLSLEVPK